MKKLYQTLPIIFVVFFVIAGAGLEKPQRAYAQVCSSDIACPDPALSCVYPNTSSLLGECQEQDLATGTVITSNKRPVNPFGFDAITDSFKVADASDFPEFIAILYRVILPIAILLGLVMVAVAGYGLMTSEGDPTKAQNAREQLTSAIMGLLFILLGVGILRTLISTLIEGANVGIGL